MKMDGQSLNTSGSGVDDERHDPGSVRAFDSLLLTAPPPGLSVCSAAVPRVHGCLSHSNEPVIASLTSGSSSRIDRWCERAMSIGTEADIVTRPT